MVAAPKINPASPLNDGLIAWYLAHPAYFGGTVWPDLSGGGHDGTLINMDPESDWGADGPTPIAASLDFDGNNDAVSAGVWPGFAPGPITAGFTFSVWYRYKQITHVGRYLAGVHNRNATWFCFLELNRYFGPGSVDTTDPGSVGLYLTASDWYLPSALLSNHNISLIDGGWHHVAVSADLSSSNVVWVVDGVTIVSQSNRTSVPSSAPQVVPWFIGAANNNGVASPVAAGVSDFRAYSRFVSPTEIAAYYAESLGGYKTVLKPAGIPQPLLEGYL